MINTEISDTLKLDCNKFLFYTYNIEIGILTILKKFII